MTSISSTADAVHGTSIYKYVPPGGIDYRALKALLVDPTALVPLLDEMVQQRTLWTRGVTTADRYQDFPPFLHPYTQDATVVRHYNLDGVLKPKKRLMAAAFLLNGRILTVNEPHGDHWINFFDGVRSTR